MNTVTNNMMHNDTSSKKYNQSIAVEAFALSLMLVLYVLSAIHILPIFEVHVDEVSYVDPAASIYFGKGLTSGAWFAQRHDAFWAGNLPLYQIILSKWINVFHFNPLSVRSLSLFFNVLGIISIWVCLVKKNLINNIRWRLGLILLLLFSTGAVTHLTIGRPDPLTTLLMSLIWLTTTISRKSIRYIILGILSLISALTAIQLCVYIAFVALITLCYEKSSYKWDTIAVVVGGTLGTSMLLFWYKQHNALDGFISSVLPHIAYGSGPMGRQSMKHHWGGFLDYSYLTMIVPALLVYISCRVSKDKYWTRTANLMLTFIITIPIGVGLVGMFPVYYNWMAFIPESILLIYILQNGSITSKIIRRLAIFFLVLSALMGYPRVYINALRYKHDEINNITNSYFASYLHDHEVALICRQAFYAVKPKADTLYYLDYSPWRMDKDEKESLTLLAMSPAEFGRIKNVIGGQWNQIGNMLVLPNRNFKALPTSQFYKNNPNIEIAIYRRVKENI